MQLDRRSTLALALGGLAMPALARAQRGSGWRPTRPIRLIVAAAPGGSNDILARIIAEPAGQVLGQPVVIENRAGAGSVIGSEAAARAPADGYTVLMNSSLATIPAVVANVPYDTLGDFDGVAVAGFSPHLLVIHPAVPARTAQEFLALLRASPGRLNYSSAGPGSGPHIGGLLLMARMNVQAETVHYRGGGPSVAALVSGEAQFGTPTMASAIGQVRGGNLRALAVLAEQRSPALPDVPSAPQAGMPGVIHEEFFPIVAPKRTPPAALEALGDAFRQAIQQTAARVNEMTGVAARTGFETSAQVMALVREGIEANTRLLRAAGVQPE
ncbi:Bug family tripartite tricarboxylate transporter substrate binding protein [Sabulicella glaciei]|uniref:Tripartite tricarboxylate transporter substrate binding protein n=1 Tax=Sabulicella glaciei TaxID=2984948 RepID=A0ABT3NTQ9_9PROT|nr:tripartite tricarboxylate transporter substrate binding protein [Roseococcus sp. MDT2-1-1]MCW8085540.1 tripartite tricarboxylate transporter substrate binding protein [Roseococcus sp. MDT2-1-1]